MNMRWQHVLVDDTPVRVESGVRFEDIVQELDLPRDSVGIYTDEDGEQTVLPPEATVTERVPRNASITVEQQVTVERSAENDLFSQSQKPATEDTESTGGGDGSTYPTVYVEGEPFTVDDQTTAAELKDVAGGDDDELLAFRDGDRVLTIEGHQRILKYADPETRFELQPQGSSIRLFGGQGVTPDPS